MSEDLPKEEVKGEGPTPDAPKPDENITPKINSSRKFILFGILGVLVLVLIGMIVWNARPTKLSYDSNSELATELDGEEMEVQPTVKTAPISSDKPIPEGIQKELPAKSPDGKKVSPDSYLNEKYLLFSTYVGPRGAGPELDYWLYDREKKSSINLSSLLKKNNEFVELYKDTPSNSGLSLSFYSKYLGENPAFSIANGWEIVGEYWVYDLDNSIFIYYPRGD